MTPLAASSDYTLLLAAICAEPGDDTVRLVAADELEAIGGTVECPVGCDNGKHRHKTVLGNGTVLQTTTKVDCRTCAGSGRVPDANAARAEFIRVQIELARLLSDRTPRACMQDARCNTGECLCCRPLVFQARSDALLLAHEATWRRGERCGRCEGKPEEFAGGTWWHCPDCHGVGWTGPLAGSLWAGSVEYKAIREDLRAQTPCHEYERGWVVQASCPLADVFGPDDKPTAWAVRLVRSEPVQRIVLSDREPHESYSTLGAFDGRSFDWANPNWTNQGSLPQFLFREVCKLYPEAMADLVGYKPAARVEFPTAADATRALATAAANVVRAESERLWALELAGAAR